LDVISHCLHVSPVNMRNALKLQKAMLKERRSEIDQILATIDYTESALQDGCENWQSIVQLIRMFQMTQDFSKKYYTEEQRQQIAEWGKNWTEEDQKVASQRWEVAIAELKRLVAAQEDPAGPSAQVLAHEWYDLVQGFTH